MPAEGAKILAIEDERPIRQFLKASLTAQGYRWLEAETGVKGLTEATSQQPDLIILDLGLPDIDGLELLGRLREWSRVPVVVLSARGQEDDKVRALEMGADDYLTKPFGIRELFARIRVALRHGQGLTAGDEPTYELGDLKVDRARRQVFIGDREVHLTPTEYRLLAAFVRNPGKLLTHRQLLLEVWGPGSEYENHYLRVYVAQLRHKLEADPTHPRYLITEPGVGYRLAAE
jgi:two-component system KDP operon response regulator KdpE